MDGTLITLLYASIAAAVAALGPLPWVFHREPSVALLGFANALAAGMMLGAAYILTAEGLGGNALAGAAGAVLGIAFVWGSHAFAGTSELRLNLTDELSPDYGYKVLVVNGLHAASEGVAIGVAMFIDLRLGIFLALAFAVHNIAEATALCAVLIPRGVSRKRAAALGVMTNVSQILLAVVCYTVLMAQPGVLTPMLGFAVGAMIYLTVVELLPEAYLEAHQTAIAVTASVAMSVVALLEVALH
ncbi:MAG: ZIP family metal transporter [Planctomycetota bacterium]|jgi:ZIP family zinc transporter